MRDSSLSISSSVLHTPCLVRRVAVDRLVDCKVLLFLHSFVVVEDLLFVMISRAVLNLVLLDFTMGAPNKGDVLSVVIVRALLDRLGVGLDDAVVALALEVLVREMLFVLAVLFFSSAPGFVLLDLLGEIVAAFAAVLVLLDSIGGPAISFLVLLDLTGAAGTLVLVDFDVFDKALALVLGLNLVLDDNVENSLLLFVGKAGMEGLLL